MNFGGDMKKNILLIIFIVANCNIFLYGDDLQVLEKKKLTLMEFGADRCIACIKMKPVIAKITEKYAESVDVQYYNVWQEKAKANEYKIKIIPAQVFLDSLGREFFRHRGFFSEKEISEILDKKIDKGR